MEIPTTDEFVIIVIKLPSFEINYPINVLVSSIVKILADF